MSEICVEGQAQQIAFHVIHSYCEYMSSVAHVRGCLAGAAILTLFGSAWCIIALASWAARPGWSIPAGFVATIALLGLCVLRLIALRNIPNIDDPAAAAKGKRAGILFGIIFGAEGGLIALCATLLARMGLDIWIPIAVAIIVGLHFLPLARVFEVPLYYWTGALSVLGMLGCSLIRDAGTRVLCAGLVMGAVLWLTAAVLLLQARPMQPQRA
ncbi:MAG: hypothetical protein WBE76_06315 [Terracidiphilus sp.]